MGQFNRDTNILGVIHGRSARARSSRLVELPGRCLCSSSEGAHKQA